MSLETDLTTLLKLRCARVYPDVAPGGVARPYITYQQIGGEVLTFVEKAVASQRNALIQINVWAATRIEANALMLQIEADMVAATTFTADPVGALQGGYNNTAQLYEALQDFTVWANR